MNITRTRSLAILVSLAALMAATRFNHFGSAVSLPDASYAVFLLGGLYLAGFTRASVIAFSVLLLEAGWIDYYATSVQGISDWCMSPAYWFLIPTYAGLWLVGRWFALKYAMEGKGLVVLAMSAWAASSFAFAFSNATFYLFSGRFAAMGAAEYTGAVAQYYVSYVSVALLYIACAVAVNMLFGMLHKQTVRSSSDAA